MSVKKVVWILFLLVAIYALVFSSHGLVKIISLRLNILRVHDKICILQAKEIVLERETKLLKNSDYIKRVAHERFGIESKF